jgi:hypothetical protein
MGERAISGNDILFLCLARNCAANLPSFFAYLERLRAAGIPCRALIGENGSQDGTRELILAASERGITLLDTAAMADARGRLARMAFGRQMLLDAARAANEDVAFICIADLDNVMEEPPAIEAVDNAMHRLCEDRSLFAIGATSRPVYYDLLALRMSGYDFSTLDAEIAAAKRKPLSYHRFHERRIYGPQRQLTASAPVLCESSFNGFCLYNAADYLLGSYRAANEAEVCEHVTMNLSILRGTGKRMLIAPDLVVRTPQDHAPVGFARFWFDRIRETALRLR